MLKNQNNKIKIFLTIFLLSIFCFWPSTKARAAWIPGVDPAIEEGLRNVSEEVKGLIIGALKQQAVSQLNSQVDSLAGGGAGGQPAFITDWKDYLGDSPKNETDVYMNDYLSEITKGRNTLSGYSTDGFTGPTNYAASLAQTVKSLNSKKPEVTYEEDPSRMFENGNFKNMESYLSGINNPWGFNMAYEAEQQKKLEEKKSEALAISTAYQGFVPVPGETPGSVVSPGILTKETIANAQKLPSEILASASTVPEVTAALTSQMINRSVTGFSSVQRSVSKKASAANRADSGTNSKIKTEGPGARFEN
jgi:hypothetical protein